MMRSIFSRRPPAEQRSLVDDVKWAAASLLIVIVAFLALGRDNWVLLIGCLLGLTLVIVRSEIARRRFRR